MAKIYFVTNRNPVGPKSKPRDFGKKFNADSIDSLRFGTAQVAAGEVKSIQVAPEKLTKDDSNSVHGSNAVFSELMTSMKAGVDTLVYIHGYKVSFHEALSSGAQLLSKYKGTKGINIIVFSWPSDGSMMPFLAYKRDRSDAVTSALAFSRGLIKLYEFLKKVRKNTQCKARLHLLCHSMGNYVLRNGIQEVRREKGYIPRVFDEIFLMAADEDYDSFEHDHKFGPLHELGHAINIYFNLRDTALVISDKTKANPTRLGSRGPRLPLMVPGNVNIIDTSEVVGGVVEHSYYLDDKSTVRDVTAVIRGGAPDRIKGRRYMSSQNRYVLSKKNV
jgi:esterase/lipase superfamily enzyme